VRIAKGEKDSFAPRGSARRRDAGAAASPRRGGRARGVEAQEAHAARGDVRRAARSKVELPEDMLQRALDAVTPRARALWARRGLACRGPLDRTTQAMLLRQLYLAYFEEERFARASKISDQIVDLHVLPDVAHQDAARVKQALGDMEGAIAHLRLAIRLGPPSRRAFHWWTLGSLYYLIDAQEKAIAVLGRAARWGTTDKPLYQAHLALAQIAAGKPAPDLGTLIDRLAHVPSGNGYGRFVLGQMAFHARRWEDARRWLEAFVQRSSSGRRAMAIALRGEIASAQQTLARLP
jgi:tetratricopeptide (TPR) repeat protein